MILTIFVTTLALVALCLSAYAMLENRRMKASVKKKEELANALDYLFRKRMESQIESLKIAL